VPSLLHNRGALAGAGSAISLVAAALASLIFAAGLIGFTAWPAGSSPSVQSVVVPTSGASTTARTQGAASVTLPGPATAPVRPAAGAAPARTVARRVTRSGSTPARTSSPSAPAPVAAAAPAPVTTPPPSSVTRQVTSRLADTTTAVTQQVGSTAGGPVGSAITSTGDAVAQTLDNVGSITRPLLG
jgi:hypothetical protein